jgi:hypothetical protein
MTIKIYRKKPVEIEAIQLLANNFDQVETFIGLQPYTHRHYTNEQRFLARTDPEGLHVKTLEGLMLARVGDYVIKGVNGEFYPCKPDIFEKTYDFVNVKAPG